MRFFLVSSLVLRKITQVNIKGLKRFRNTEENVIFFVKQNDLNDKVV